MELLVGVLFVGIPLSILLFAIVWLTMGGSWARPREDFTGAMPDPQARAMALLEQDYEGGRISLDEYERRRAEIQRGAP